MTDFEYKECIERLDTAMKTILKGWLSRPGAYLEPCKNCGRCVYIGKCCANPDSEVKYHD